VRISRLVIVGGYYTTAFCFDTECFKEAAGDVAVLNLHRLTAGCVVKGLQYHAAEFAEGAVLCLDVCKLRG
jgi:hypothetical protein